MNCGKLIGIGPDFCKRGYSHRGLCALTDPPNEWCQAKDTDDRVCALPWGHEGDHSLSRSGKDHAGKKMKDMTQEQAFEIIRDSAGPELKDDFYLLEVKFWDGTKHVEIGKLSAEPGLAQLHASLKEKASAKAPDA